MSRPLRLCGVMILLTGLAISAEAGGKADDAGKKPGPARADASAASADWNNVAQGDKVTVRGRIRLVGSELFRALVISDDKGHSWYIDDSDKPTLAGLEQRTITVRGTVEIRKMVLANGKRLDDRRTLRGISIVQR